MKPYRTLLDLCCAGVLLLARGQAQSLLSEYTFDDSGVTAANAVGGGAAMSLYNGSGAATDTRSIGVSGAAGDSAWDGHDYASGMSTTGAYGVVAGGSSVFGGLASFTITGWYDAASSTGTGSGTARLFAASNVVVQFLGGIPGLSLTVNGGSAIVPANGSAYDTTSTNGGWTFLAISYDSTLGQVSFYVGSQTGAVSLVGTTTLGTNPGAVNASSSSLYFGNRGTTATPNDRTFDGLLDDFRVYGGTFGAGSAATSGLDAVRLSALAVPEPGAAPLLLPAGALGLAWGLRRRAALFP